MKIGYIPGSATMPKTRKARVWEYRQIPAMYTPAHIRATTDFSAFYEKTPAEMSRYELTELERIMRMTEEEIELAAVEEIAKLDNVIDKNGKLLTRLEAYRISDEFTDLRDEIRKLQPMRIGIFKRYWDKFKYNKDRRETLVEMFDTADEQVEFYLEKEHKSWRDEIPGVRKFLSEISTKKISEDVRLSLKGNTIIRNTTGRHEIEKH